MDIIQFGMPTLIEHRNLEETVMLCKELGLEFIELNMNLPQYQIECLENTDEFLKNLGCLCVIPEYQGKGIGSRAIEFMLDYYTDWSKITLVTPADKEENINFYTKKCGFKVDGTEMDGNVKLVHFSMER